MRRPAFQFYPADWRNNAKLRRCSWGARGVWIELMGLMHDSDNYGVLAWPLKQIAQALGAPIKLLKELVDCGVLYGSEQGDCEPMIYTPISGRVKGAPVELIAAQPGPLWYSPRMVRDEYVRQRKGESTRFGSDGDAPSPSPKPPIGESKGAALSRRQGDGSTASSSSSSSVPNGTSAAADAWQRFPMAEGWQPDDVSLASQLRVAGLARDCITDEVIAGFIGHFLTLPDTVENAAGWCKRLVKWAKRQHEFTRGNANESSKARGSRPASGISLADNLNDTSWAEGLGTLQPL